MLTGRAGGAHGHAGAAAGGAGGEDSLPCTSQRRRCGCRGSCEAAGPLRKGWRVAEHGPGCCHIPVSHTPAPGGPRLLLDTRGHHPQQNFSRLQDAAQPRDAFLQPWMAGVALQAPSCCHRLGHLRFGAEDLCQREELFVATQVAVLLGVFLAGFAATSRVDSQLGEGLLVLSGS